MATPTKIVVHFDDGTAEEFSVKGMSSVFLNEAAAVKCGHKPPYQPGPPPDAAGATRSAPDGETATTTDTKCYYMNGVIICP